jgi:hypothetical protein
VQECSFLNVLMSCNCEREHFAFGRLFNIFLFLSNRLKPDSRFGTCLETVKERPQDFRFQDIAV